MDTSYAPWPVEHLSIIPDRDFDAYPDLYYRYQKLETRSSFRLLKFEKIPEDPNSRHYYTLIHATFEQAPAYETLSYVWGTIHRNVSISMKNGKLLRITEPLKDALSVIEEQCETGLIWIDQICIDQDDHAERGHQVKVMGQIYSSCIRVIVWLGRFDESDRNSLGSRNASVLSPSRYHSRTRSPLQRLGNHLREFRHSSKLPISSLTDERLASLQSPWFQRAWVFQEVVLPPDALLVLGFRGAEKVSTMSLPILHHLINQAGWSNTHDPRINTALNMFDRWSERRNANAKPCAPIEEYLSRLTPSAQTSEYLDKLYAFFGLNLNLDIQLNPAYNVSFKTALFETSSAIIRGTHSLDILELVARAETREHTKDPYTADRKWRIPSWCPDFRQVQLVQPFKRSDINFKEFFSNDLRIYRWYPQVNEHRVLEFYGYELDVIHARIGTLSQGRLTEANFEALLASAQSAWESAKAEYEESKIDEDIWQHQTALQTDFASPPTMKSLCTALTAEGLSERISDGDSMHLGEVIRNYAKDMLEVMNCRELWVTKSGRLAVGRFGHKAGIFLAYGCSNPISLFKGSRAQNYTSGTFPLWEDIRTQTSGTCFLEGWMDPWSNGKMKKLEEMSTCTFRSIH